MLIGERNVFQIVFRTVWVFGVFLLLFLFLHLLLGEFRLISLYGRAISILRTFLCLGIGRLSIAIAFSIFTSFTIFSFIAFLFLVIVGQHRLVGTPPVVGQLTLSPFLLEFLTSRFHSLRIIEIPHASTLVATVGTGIDRSVTSSHVGAGIIRAVGFSGLFGLLFLLLFHLLYHLMDYLHTLHRIHASQVLQTVLQFHSRCMLIEFLQNLGAFVNVFIVLTLLIEKPQGTGIAVLGFHEFFFFPVQLAEM